MSTRPTRTHRYETPRFLLMSLRARTNENLVNFRTSIHLPNRNLFLLHFSDTELVVSKGNISVCPYVSNVGRNDRKSQPLDPFRSSVSPCHFQLDGLQ